MADAADLLDALRDAWPYVHVNAGWQARGTPWSAGDPVGVMHHHTAPPVPFPIDRLNGSSDGRIKCNMNTKPDGSVWLVAYGACNYSSGLGSSTVLAEARAGQPPSKNAGDRNLNDDTNGNPWFWNFENDHPGDGSDLPDIQHEAIVTATQVVLDFLDLDAGNVISHAEWTARKIDPYWNGDRRCIEEIRASLGGEMQPPDWAVPATQWHIDRNIYTEDNVEDVDESLEFHRQTVFRHRFYNSIKGEFGDSGPADTISIEVAGKVLGQ